MAKSQPGTTTTLWLLATRAVLVFSISSIVFELLTDRTVSYPGLNVIYAALLGVVFIASFILPADRVKQDLDVEAAHAIIQSTSDMVSVAHPDGRVHFINPAGRAMLGLSPDEDVRGRTIADFHPPASTRRILEEAIPAARQRGVWEGETVVLTRDGREIPVSQVVLALHGSGTEPEFYTTVIRDISRMKEAERTAREGMELARRAEAFSLVMVARCDPQGNWLYASPRLCQLLGYTLEELQARKFSDVTLAEDAGPDWEQCQRILRGEIQSFEMEKRYVRKDGALVWVYLNSTGVFDGAGKLQYFQAYIRDITEQKRSQEALQASERRFHAVFNSPVVGMVLWRGAELTEANDCFLRLLGYSREEFKAKHLFWPDITPLEYKELDDKCLEEIRLTGAGTPFEKEYLRKDGSRVPILIGPIASDVDKGGGVAFVIDISEKRRTELALRETAERLMLIAEATNDALWDREIPSGKSWWNDIYRRRFGFGQDVLPSFENWKSRVHPDDVARVMESMRISESGNMRAAWNAEYRYRLADGTYATVLDRAIILRNEKGEAYRIAGAMLDLTERVKAGEALRESERRLTTLIDNLPGIVYRCHNDRDWTMAFLGGMCEEITGYPCEAFLQSNPTFNEIFHPDDRESTWNAVQEGIRRRGHFALSYRIRTRGGEIRRMQEYGRPVFDDQGELIALEGIIFDYTDRMRLEEALKENEERYRLLFKNAPDAITVLDMATGKFVEHNAQAEKLFKMTSEELLRVGPADVSPEFQADGVRSEVRAREMCEEALRGGSPRFEWVHLDKHGRSVPCEIWLSRLPDKERQLVRGSLIDISARKLLEEQLRQAQKMEAVGKLAGGIAHDFNNLLVAIIGYGELIRTQAAEGSSQRTGAEQILIAAQRAADLTRQLLAYSRKQILQPKIISLSKTVSDMHRLLERLIGEDIEFVQMLEAAGSVSADPGQIEQVIMNLVLNARDAMPAGGRLTIETLDVELDENYKQQHGDVVPGSYVMLAVSDTGVGMDREIIDRIFEPFFTTKEVGKGTGLGLSTVYGIVKQSGGNVFVYSEPGKGSTFKLYLPRVKAINAVEAPLSIAPVQPRGREVILLVEDEEGVRKLVLEVLRRQGYQMLEACDGVDALRVAQAFAGTIDLLVTDVVLPKMGGAQVARELMRLRPGIRVLFMSGYTENAVVHHGVLDTGVEYLQKPFMPAEFARKVRTLLDKPSANSGANKHM